MTCPLCLGSGRIAVGPWGSRPAKTTCPACGGKKEVGIDEIAAIEKEYNI